MTAELSQFPEVRLLPRTTVTGYYDQNYLIMAERKTDHLPRGAAPGGVRQRLWKVRARHVVLATGSHERPLVFADNDRPGVMLAGAVRSYVNRYGVLPGRRAVVFTNNDSAYETAVDLKRAGGEVAAIVDLRPEAVGPLANRARELGIPIVTGSGVVATRGNRRVTGVGIAPLSADGESVRRPCSDRRLRSCRDVGWLESGGASVFAIRRQASLRRCAEQFRARAFGAGCNLGRRVQGQLCALRLSCRRSRSRTRCRQGGRLRGGGTAEIARNGPGRCRAVTPSLDRAGEAPARPWQRQTFRRLPERCHGRRRDAGVARGLSVYRASEALYDHRHGHRPGQDLQRQRPRHPVAIAGRSTAAAGHDDLQAALYTRHLWHAGGT